MKKAFITFCGSDNTEKLRLAAALVAKSLALTADILDDIWIVIQFEEENFYDLIEYLYDEAEDYIEIDYNIEVENLDNNISYLAPISITLRD